MSLAENTHGIARIIATGPDGIGEKHTGMAIVIDVRHVMTCCHVLNDALARTNRLDSASPPEDELFDIRFPYAANAKRAGKVVQWGLALQSDKDVAVIELTEDAPSEAGVAVFSEAEARTMGWCCVGADNASIYREPEGRLGSVLPDGTRQLNGPTGVGARIAPGYSGAPVWSDDVKAFVGMVVTKDRDQFVENGLAYAIPTPVLVEVWPELPQRRLANELAAAVADKVAYCRERNLKFRSPHLLAALLGLKGEFAPTCFEVGRKGYVGKLNRMVDMFLARQGQKESERGFDPVVLDEHPVVLAAFTLAKDEGAAVVDERHLLLAFLDSGAALSERIRNELRTSEYARFRQYILDHRPGHVNIGPTPDSLFDQPEGSHVQPDQL